MGEKAARHEAGPGGSKPVGPGGVLGGHGAAPPEAGVGWRALLSWCLYDWANSAFPTVITTFVFAAYFTTSVAANPTLGTAQWGRAIALAAVAVAIFGPVLGAIADRGGRRKPWLFAFTAACIGATAMLWFVRPAPEYTAFALVFVAIAIATFEFGGIFYNTMLPALARAGTLGRLSGWGWGLGYVGGVVCLLLALAILAPAGAARLGLDPAKAEPVRATALLVAVWFGLFSVPIFLFTPDRAATGRGLGTAVTGGLAALVQTLRGLRRQPVLARFLLARMIYADGLNTLFAFGGVYAAGTFHMSLPEVIRFAIALNITAALGAALFAWVDDWIGSLRTILLALIGLVVMGAAILVARSPTWFWVFGLALGIFVGPVQAASRALMARLAPVERRAEMFGIYALTGKVTAFLGPLLVGSLTLAFDSQRAGMAVIVVFFGVGLVLLLPLRRRAP